MLWTKVASALDGLRSETIYVEAYICVELSEAEWIISISMPYNASTYPVICSDSSSIANVTCSLAAFSPERGNNIMQSRFYTLHSFVNRRLFILFFTEIFQHPAGIIQPFWQSLQCLIIRQITPVWGHVIIFSLVNNSLGNPQ